MYKLVAFDLDGTLLNTNGEISDYSKEIIKKLIDNNIYVIITTGRPLQGVKYIAEVISTKMPIVCYNGSLVYTGYNMDILHKCDLEIEIVNEILNFGNENNTNIIVWSADALYINKNNEYTKKYADKFDVKPIILKNTDALRRHGVSKVLFYDSEKRICEINNLAQAIFSKHANVHTSRPWFLEFVNKRASKGKALEKLGDSLKVNREDIIAIGDENNDISMIEYAGVGVAMGNATRELKEVADFITDTNDDNGAVKAVLKYIDFLNIK